MKKLLTLLICIFLCNYYLFSQVTEQRTTTPINKETLSGLPHAKGKWQFEATVPYLSYNSANVKANNVDAGDQSSLNLDLGADYFFAKGLAAGVQLMYDVDKIESLLSETTTTDWSIGARFTWQRQLSDKINFFVRAGPTIGGIKDKYTYAGNTQTDKATSFGFRGEVGFPMEITNNGTVSFVPSIFYRYRTTDYKDQDFKETDGRYGINLRMMTNLFCGEMRCDGKTNYTLSKGLYEQGHSFIGITTKGMIAGGKTTYKDDDPLIPENEEDYFAMKLAFEYMYYLMDNLAGGLQVDYRSNTTKADPDYEVKSNQFIIAPTLQLNLPVKNAWLNNTFISASYQFGGSKNENSYGSVTNKEEYKINGYSVGVGHNFQINRNVAITPTLNYESQTIENKEDAANEEWEYSGIYFGVGARITF